MRELKEIQDESQKKLLSLERKLNSFFLYRLFSFSVFLYFVISRYSDWHYITVSLVSLAIFFGFVGMSVRLTKRTNFLKNIVQVCDDIINCRVIKTPIENIDVAMNHPYAYDLDIFGNRSLFDNINQTQTKFGFERLVAILSKPLSSMDKIIQRQSAIKELRTKINWGITFLATIKANEKDKLNTEKIINWAEIIEKSIFKHNLPQLLYILPAINFLFIGVVIFLNLSSSLLSLPILFSLIFTYFHKKDINNIYKAASLNSKEISKYRKAFVLIEEEEFISQELSFFKADLKSEFSTASSSINALNKLIDAFDQRNNMLIATLLNGLLLWDLQCAYRIEKWKRSNSKVISSWFSVVGEFEALVSLGIFYYKNEEFNFPENSQDGNLVVTKGMSHPLITKDRRIYNDFIISDDNVITIITGANMAGKSTFLRSIGTNMVLAMIGCPVCADYFSFVPASLFTSMRTNDSLSDGSSYFLSEIKRLQELIIKLTNGEPCFILLDEILKGTNSDDKLKGSELLIEKILKFPTLFACIIATHDLKLTEMEIKYTNVIKNYCFELNMHNSKLEPDFKLQKGVTKSMNALRLMKSLGIID